MKKIFFYIAGLLIGIINGMLGTGGGMIAVPVLEKGGVASKDAHSTAIAVILPVTVISAFFYFKGGVIDVKSTTVLAVAGMAGGFVGAKLLSKVPRKILKIFFGGSMIYMAARMLFKK